MTVTELIACLEEAVEDGKEDNLVVLAIGKAMVPLHDIRESVLKSDDESFDVVTLSGDNELVFQVNVTDNTIHN